MARSVLLLWLPVLLCAQFDVLAGEHAACRDIDYDYMPHSPSELREIAVSCSRDSMAELYYSRACHAELLAEAKTLSQLISYSNTRAGKHSDAYRIYIGLIESLAPIWYRDTTERVAFLNSEYRLHSEAEELRLHGFDRLVDYMDQ